MDAGGVAGEGHDLAGLGQTREDGAEALGRVGAAEPAGGPGAAAGLDECGLGDAEGGGGVAHAQASRRRRGGRPRGRGGRRAGGRGRGLRSRASPCGCSCQGRIPGEIIKKLPRPASHGIREIGPQRRQRFTAICCGWKAAGMWLESGLPLFNTGLILNGGRASAPHGPRCSSPARSCRR